MRRAAASYGQSGLGTASSDKSGSSVEPRYSRRVYDSACGTASRSDNSAGVASSTPSTNADPGAYLLQGLRAGAGPATGSRPSSSPAAHAMNVAQVFGHPPSGAAGAE